MEAMDIYVGKMEKCSVSVNYIEITSHFSPFTEYTSDDSFIGYKSET